MCFPEVEVHEFFCFRDNITKQAIKASNSVNNIEIQGFELYYALRGDEIWIKLFLKEKYMIKYLNGREA